jgi:hypothetical protein
MMNDDHVILVFPARAADDDCVVEESSFFAATPAKSTPSPSWRNTPATTDSHLDNNVNMFFGNSTPSASTPDKSPIWRRNIDSDYDKDVMFATAPSSPLVSTPSPIWKNNADHVHFGVDKGMLFGDETPSESPSSFDFEDDFGGGEETLSELSSPAMWVSCADFNFDLEEEKLSFDSAVYNEVDVEEAPVVDGFLSLGKKLGDGTSAEVWLYTVVDEDLRMQCKGHEIVAIKTLKSWEAKSALQLAEWRDSMLRESQNITPNTASDCGWVEVFGYIGTGKFFCF